MHAGQDEPFEGNDRFEVKSRLGEGGMGVVYLVHDRERGHDVALKVLPAGFKPSEARRLRREFRTLADVTHPNLVTLHELVVDDSRTYFTMEYVPGVELVEWVVGAVGVGVSGGSDPHASMTRPSIPSALPLDAADGAAGDAPTELPPTRADLGRLRDALRQVADALGALHVAGRLHLDIKPSNVLVRDDGRVVVLDFGISRSFDSEDESSLTQTHEISGTPTYMAPEQALGAEVGAPADWYAVGTMLFVALTGRLPYEGKVAAVLLAKQLKQARRASSLASGIPADLDELVAGLLERQPEARAGRAEVLAWCDAGASEARPSQPPPPIAVPFVGRAGELEALERALREVAAGRPMVVWVGGASGTGKTALVRHFVEGLRESRRAVVLRGRCYERETAPFKTFDGVAEALMRHLRRLSDSEAAALLPRGAAELGRVFPSLLRWQALELAVQRARIHPDPREVRTRAFRALRELLGRITAKLPVVLWIDDVQWTDADSILLLEQLLAPPDPPPLLLVGTFRSEERASNELLQALLEAPTRSGVEARAVDLEPLPREEAECLARALAVAAGAPSLELEPIVAESQGSPLLVAELVRHVASTGPGAARGSSLEELLLDRIRALAPDVRRVLELVALVGAPVEQGAILRAASVGESDDLGSALGLLRTANLVRTRGGRPTDSVECYHERLRQTVGAHMPADRRRHLFGRLADALEQTSSSDTALVAYCWREAGDLARAAARLERAADEASAALAFDRAARLYREALLTSGESQRPALQRSLAEALANAGRGREAGDAFLVAAGASTSLEALELRRRASEQYLTSGHQREGAAVLDDLLAAVDLPHLITPRSAVLWILWQRARNAIRGMEWVERPEAEIAPETLLQVDVCLTAVLAFTVVEPVCGAAYEAILLSHALDAGEPRRLAMAFALEAMHLSFGGREVRVGELMAASAAICRRLDDPLPAGFLALCSGLIALLEGNLREAVADTTRAEVLLRDCPDAAHHLDQVNLVQVGALTLLGELDRVATLLDGRLRVARERGNRHAAATLRVIAGGHALVHLARDAPDFVLADLDETLRAWTSSGFQLQHLHALLSRVYVDLYRGDGARALARLEESWKPLERSLHLKMEATRVHVLATRASAALSAATLLDDPTRCLRIAGKCERSLRSVDLVWAQASADLIAAQLELVAARTSLPLRLLRSALEGFERAELSLHATTVRRALGRLLGDEGAALREQGDGHLTRLGVVRPDAFCRVFAPVLFALPTG